MLFSAANVLPFDLDEWLTCLPDGRIAVWPDYDVRIPAALFRAAVGQLQDRYFDTDLADVKPFILKLRKQVAEDEQVHNIALPNIPRRIGKIG